MPLSRLRTDQDDLGGEWTLKVIQILNENNVACEEILNLGIDTENIDTIDPGVLARIRDMTLDLAASFRLLDKPGLDEVA